MPEPTYKIAKNKSTGEWWRVRVHDDGTVEPVEAIAAEPAAAPQPQAPAEPAPIEQPQMMQQPAPAPSAPEEPQQSLYERFLGWGNDMIKAADAAAGSFMRTDLTDKIGVAIADALPVPGIDKSQNRYAEGNSYQSLAQGNERDMRQAEQRYPWATATGDAAQTMAAAMLYGPQNAAASLPARAVTGAAEGAVLGGTQRAGSAPADASNDELLEEYISGAKVGGTVGAAVPLAGAATSAVAKPIARKAGSFANRMRAAAPGGYGAELKRLANREGLEYTDEALGQEIERLIPPKLLPRSPRDYAEEALPKLEAARKASGKAIDDATEMGVTAPLRGVEDDIGIMEGLDAARRRAAALHGSTNKAYARRLDKEAKGVLADFPGPENQRLTARQIQDLKLGLEEGGYPSSPLANISDSASARAQRDAAVAPRDALDYAMKNQAPEDVYETWINAKRDIGPLEEIESMARGRAAQESGNQLMSLPTSIAFAGGGALGGSAMGGAEGGLLGAGAGLASLAGTELVKRYGRDALANAARGTSRAAGLLSRTAPEVGAASVPAAASAAAGRAENARILDETFGTVPAMADEGSSQPSTQSALGEHPTAARARQALSAAPWMLGDYAPQMQEALERGPKEYGSLLLRLQKDPEFMRSVMPVIAAERGQENAR